MYAVIRSGGKQYRVSPGGSVRLEKLPGEVGASITLDDVLMVGGEGDVKIGTPTVDGARVTGTIVAQGRGEKITIFKMKRQIRELGEGKLKIPGKLRKGDELVDFFEAFDLTVRSLRQRQEHEIALLDAAMEKLEEGSAGLESLKELRAEMQDALDA